MREKTNRFPFFFFVKIEVKLHRKMISISVAIYCQYVLTIQQTLMLVKTVLMTWYICVVLTFRHDPICSMENLKFFVAYYAIFDWMFRDEKYILHSRNSMFFWLTTTQSNFWSLLFHFVGSFVVKDETRKIKSIFIWKICLDLVLNLT